MRLSARLRDGLVFGYDALPQYAGTSQRVADIFVENQDGKPTKILRSEGSYFKFDEAGCIVEGLRDSLAETMSTHEALERSKQSAGGPVVDIRPKLNREKWAREHRWQLSQNDLDRVAADIWGKAKTDRATIAKGVASKPPPVTLAARCALREIKSKIADISGHLEDLTEPALKGLAYAARKEGKHEPLLVAVAETADRKREILQRYRTGRGTWYAIIRTIKWDEFRRQAETQLIAEEKCTSKKEAEEVARRLLAEHAVRFDSFTDVEVSVACDLEHSSNSHD